MTLSAEQSNQALAVAGAAWAFLDAESRNVHAETVAALQVFQASWNSWSAWARDPDTSPVQGVHVPTSLAPGSWDADTKLALQIALITATGAGSAIANAFPEGGAARAANTMPAGPPPLGGRGTWFVTTYATRFDERSTDPVTRQLWSCAAVVRGAGIDAGAALSRRTYEIASGIPSIAPAARAAAHASNSNVADLLAHAAGQMPHDITLDPITVTGRRPQAQSEIPWTPIIVGVGALAVALGLGAFFLSERA